MPTLYLTPASISYLNQFLLSLSITVYLIWRFVVRPNTRASTADRFLVFFFITTTLFSLALFLEVSFLPTARLIVVYLLNSLLALLLVFLIQFAYNFPEPAHQKKIERWLALLVSLAYLGWELKIAIERFLLLSQAEVVFRPPNLDYWPVALFGWVVFVFARGTVKHWHNVAARRFALIFLIPVILMLLTIGRSYDYISTPFYHISVSVGILLCIFLFALNYLVSQPESTSLLVKFSGTVLTATLSLFGVIAWLVTPAYAAQYRPALIDNRTIRFTPNDKGGYDVEEIPCHFEMEKGRLLRLKDKPNSPEGYAQVEFPFPFFGQTYERLFVHHDGRISFGEPGTSWSLEYRLSNLPLFFALFLDLYPEANPQSGIYLHQETQRLIVTYDQVSAYYQPEQKYTFQVILYPDGRIDLTYNGLPAQIQYSTNDRPDASPWLIGAKPGLDSAARVSFARLPLSFGPEGALDDQYLAFRQFIHAFLAPLAIAILVSNLLFLVGLPFLLLRVIARPLQTLLYGVEQFDRNQKHERIPVEYSDEIGYLTTAFNNMTSALDDLIRNLEMPVSQRTADLQNANAELRKLSVAVEQSPSSIMITNPQAEIEYVNAAFTLATGYTFEEVKGQNPRILKSGQTPPETFQEMWTTLQAGKTWRGELINRRKNGEIYWEFTVIAPIHAPDGQIIHYVAVKEDITARKIAEARLEELAITDPLTGLLNRRGFFAQAEPLYERSLHPPYELAALMMDIDHFKTVNDRFGHQAGDAVLRAVAACIRHNLRPTDLVARYGGEEFVALLPRAHLGTLQEIAHRINQAVKQHPVTYNGIEICVTISIGGAKLNAESRSLDELLLQADQAMYQAKAAGRDCVVISRDMK